MMKKQIVAQLLLNQKAVFLNPHEPFTWTSGIKSPVYCDNRLLISAVEPRNVIVELFCEKIREMNIDAIAGTATAGIPWASWIAYELKLPMVYVRSSKKAHGRKNAVEGQIPHGSKCVLIEDLVSTGKSSIEAALHLRDENLAVENILSIFTYDFSNVEESFRKNNLKFESLTQFDILAQVAFDDNLLDQKALEDVLLWQKNTKVI